MASIVVLVMFALLQRSVAAQFQAHLAKYTQELLFDLCSGPGLTLDATGPGSAVYIVAEQPRRAVSDKCVFMVRANNSDGVVISMQKMKLRRSTAVDGICLDYVEFTGEGGRNHLTVCGSDLRSYEATVPFNVQMYINPTQYYEPGELVAFVITGYNKTTQDDCKGGSFTCANSRCIWDGFSCDKTDNCGDGSDEKYFVSSMCIMPMTALVLIVSGIAVILASLIMICYCMARLRTQLQRALEEERAYRSRKVDSWSEGPYSEFVDTYGSMIPRQPLMSSVYQSGDQAGPYARRLSSMPRAVSYTQ